ncbi:MAG: flagellar basal body rod protein [Asticcacaulis sp.]
MSAISTATAGVLSASQRFDKAATATVREAAGGGDILSHLVEQIESRTAFHASINVVKTADDMLGKLLDITT